MVKCPVHKHEDLRSDPLAPMYRPDMCLHICDPDAREWETVSSPELAGQLVNPALDSVRDPVPR